MAANPKFCTRGSNERLRPRDIVGVNVRFKHVRDDQVLRACIAEVSVHVPLRIDYNCSPLRTKQVRIMCKAKNLKSLNNHESPSLSAAPRKHAF